MKRRRAGTRSTRREKKKVENMFVEKGWTVRMSKRRMKGR